MAVVFVFIKAPGQHELFVIADTADLIGFFFGTAQGWQQHRCENCNDRYNHQKLDQGESALCKTGSICARTCHIATLYKAREMGMFLRAASRRFNQPTVAFLVKTAVPATSSSCKTLFNIKP